VKSTVEKRKKTMEKWYREWKRGIGSEKARKDNGKVVSGVEKRYQRRTESRKVKPDSEKVTSGEVHNAAKPDTGKVKPESGKVKLGVEKWYQTVEKLNKHWKSETKH